MKKILSQMIQTQANALSTYPDPQNTLSCLIFNL